MGKKRSKTRVRVRSVTNRVTNITTGTFMPPPTPPQTPRSSPPSSASSSALRPRLGELCSFMAWFDDHGVWITGRVHIPAKSKSLPAADKEHCAVPTTSRGGRPMATVASLQRATYWRTTTILSQWLCGISWSRISLVGPHILGIVRGLLRWGESSGRPMGRTVAARLGGPLRPSAACGRKGVCGRPSKSCPNFRAYRS